MHEKIIRNLVCRRQGLVSWHVVVAKLISYVRLRKYQEEFLEQPTECWIVSCHTKNDATSLCCKKHRLLASNRCGLHLVLAAGSLILSISMISVLSLNRLLQKWISRTVVSLLRSTAECCLEVFQNCTACSCCGRTGDHLSICWCRWFKNSWKKTSCDYAAMAMYLLILSILACENQIVQLVPARRSRLQSSLAQDQAFDPEPAKERSDQHSSVCMNLTFKLVHTKKIKMTMTNYEKKHWSKQATSSWVSLIPPAVEACASTDGMLSVACRATASKTTAAAMAETARRATSPEKKHVLVPQPSLPNSIKVYQIVIQTI